MASGAQMWSQLNSQRVLLPGQKALAFTEAFVLPSAAREREAGTEN